MCKVAADKVLKMHVKYLKENNWYNPVNFVDKMPTTPSYSIMHSLEEGFSIVMYSGTHRVNLYGPLVMHQANAVRLHLPPWMCIIWHESLYHSGAKARGTYPPQLDRRFFPYVWPFAFGNSRKRDKDSMDGVAREIGDSLYRNHVHVHTCLCLYKKYSTCRFCNFNRETGKSPESVVDLRGVPPTSYNPGDRIIGELDQFGWVVCRGIRIDQATYNNIDRVCKLGRGEDGTWYPIDTRCNHKMKYKGNSAYPKEDNDSLLAKFRSDINSEILGKILPKEHQYRCGKHNFIQNMGDILDDQQPHRDYPPRLVA